MELRRFARKLAELLEEGKRDGVYDDLVLVADPKFLGALREELLPETRRSPIVELQKDLARTTVDQAQRYLVDALDLRT